AVVGVELLRADELLQVSGPLAADRIVLDHAVPYVVLREGVAAAELRARAGRRTRPRAARLGWCGLASRSLAAARDPGVPASAPSCAGRALRAPCGASSAGASSARGRLIGTTAAAQDRGRAQDHPARQGAHTRKSIAGPPAAPSGGSHTP